MDRSNILFESFLLAVSCMSILVLGYFEVKQILVGLFLIGIYAIYLARILWKDAKYRQITEAASKQGTASSDTINDPILEEGPSKKRTGEENYPENSIQVRSVDEE